MQAQATGSRRYGSNRIAMLALLIGALAIAAAALVLSDTVALPFTSERQAVMARPLDRMAGYNQIGFVEQNVQLPNGILPVPAQSIERQRFLEQNTQLPTGTVRRPAPSVEHLRFLEQNIWDYADGSAVVPGLDEYLFLEEYVAGKEMEDANSTAPGIHRDEVFTYAPDE